MIPSALPTRSLFLLALASTASVPAQLHPEGFAATLEPLPAATQVVLATSYGLVACSGGTVTLTPPGQTSVRLLQLSGPVFASFLLEVGPGQVLFGHTGFGSAPPDAVWLLPLQGPAATVPLAAVPFNYEAVLLTPTRALLSARTGGFGAASNDLLSLDLVTGATQPVASLPGASGAIAVAANGDVLYATAPAALPAPPGSVQVVRFPRAVLDQAIATGQVLGLADAVVVRTGLDAASDLAFDDDGELYFVDWMQNRIGVIHDATGPAPWPGAPLADYSGATVFPATLQFTPAPGPGVYEPFQRTAATMLVLETDYLSVSQLRQVAPAAASLASTGTVPQVAGPFDLVLADGPSAGLAVLLLSLSAAPGDFVLTLPGGAQPLVLNQAIASWSLLYVLALDASGTGQQPLHNPGFAVPFTATAQALFVSTDGVLGATPELLLPIAQ